MKAAPEDQRRLLDLQTVDTALAQVNHRRAALPETGEAKELATRRARLAERMVEADTHLADLTADAAKAEADIVPVRERRERNQRRVDAGELTDPKALAAMVEEISNLDRRTDDLELVQLEAMEAVDQAQAKLDALTDKKVELEGTLREVLTVREGKLAELDAERSAHEAERATVLAALPAELVELYAKVAAKLGGVGAALLQRGRCTGCQLEANAADLVRYREAPADEVLRCEECNRILIRTDESGL
ncbi:MAG: zinc ribbon domain-containing protein [Propioniciclava sp.]